MAETNQAPWEADATATQPTQTTSAANPWEADTQINGGVETPKPMFSRGDRGDPIREIQQALIDNGITSGGRVDGSFGRNTETAIQDYQALAGLPQTGVLDNETYQKLVFGAPIQTADTNAIDQALQDAQAVDTNFSFKLPETSTAGSAERTVYQEAVSQGLSGPELSAFMAQVNHESAGFSSMRERGYSYSRNYASMPRAWKERLARDGVNASNGTAAAIFNSVYANRNGNGDFASGDGNRYRGRGFIQLTGRANYRQVGEAIGVDLEGNPQLMEDPAVAAKASVAWWKINVEPVISDFTNIGAVSGVVNRGDPNKQAHGLSERRSLFNFYSGQ